jgi:hypothetical protein
MIQKQYLELNFGIGYPSLRAQLKKQKFKYDNLKLMLFEKLNFQISSLAWQNILTDKERDRARKKLFYIIKRHIQSKNK